MRYILCVLAIFAFAQFSNAEASVDSYKEKEMVGLEAVEDISRTFINESQFSGRNTGGSCSIVAIKFEGLIPSVEVLIVNADGKRTSVVISATTERVLRYDKRTSNGGTHGWTVLSKDNFGAKIEIATAEDVSSFDLRLMTSINDLQTTKVTNCFIAEQ